jgi:hypothetical protein
MSPVQKFIIKSVLKGLPTNNFTGLNDYKRNQFVVVE